MNPIQSRRLAQEADDTYRRALVGGVFYLAAWLVVGFYGNAFSRAPLASWALVIAFLILTIARIVRRPPRQAASDAQRLRWLRVHWGIVVLTTALWGAVLAWAMHDPEFGPSRIAALVSTLGLANAFAHAFSMRLAFAAAGIAMLYVPGLVLLWDNVGERPAALVMSVYLVYIVVTLVRSHADYQQRLDLDQDLRDQRDLFARQSRIDPLTELANRRHFADVLGHAVERQPDAGEPLCLLLLDLDHFKRINDTHGHAVGDACLIAFAARLRGQFSGPGELAARIGGEEFGIVLERQVPALAIARAELLRSNLVAEPIELDGMRLPLTVSIGVVAFAAPKHRDQDGLYRAADRAVYQAKRAGRNRVCEDQPAFAWENS